MNDITMDFGGLSLLKRLRICWQIITGSLVHTKNVRVFQVWSKPNVRRS